MKVIPHNFKDLAGMHFGRWRVVEYGYPQGKSTYWKCVCSCGTERYVRSSRLLSGESLSCGCYRLEQLASQKTTHGMTDTRLYGVWHGMKNRCLTKSATSYAMYGGTGITVCDEWVSSFEVFHEWAMQNGYEPGLNIDRIDGSGPYAPSNCRWVTSKENQRNRRNNKILCVDGIRKSVAEWAEKTRTPYNTIYSRVRYGWSDHDAVNGKKHPKDGEQRFDEALIAERSSK